MTQRRWSVMVRCDQHLDEVELCAVESGEVAKQLVEKLVTRRRKGMLRYYSVRARDNLYEQPIIRKGDI